MSNAPLDPGEFGASFKSFLAQMSASAPNPESALRRRVREHFDAEPSSLPVVTENVDQHERPNLHLALEELRESEWRTDGAVGVTSPYGMHGLTLSAVVAPPAAGERMMPVSEGPLEFVNVDIGDGRVLACVKSGLFLLRCGDRRVALFVHGTDRGYRDVLVVEVMARDRAAAETLLGRIRTSMRRLSVFRGRVLSIEPTCDGSMSIRFHRLPQVGRDAIVLPEGLLERIERQTVRFGRLRDSLRAMGRHLKRGVLLHGPPGTGKTFTAMFLAGQMPDRTVILLTGRGAGTVEDSCRLARLLEPATVVVEDVDLIAEERNSAQLGRNALLFELLNQMDGLSDDADVLFLLTTNRPDLLEPALAARPGRVDLAVEVPLPDRACRRRLLELYGRGLELRLGDLDDLVRRTEGVSAAFLRELLRKAALFAADEGSRAVESAHVEAALRELLVDGGTLTKTLLGARDLG